MAFRLEFLDPTMLFFIHLADVSSQTILDALRDIVPFVQFKKRKKHPWRSVTFNQPATSLKVTLLHGCFSRFLNCANDTKSHNASLWGSQMIVKFVSVCFRSVFHNFSVFNVWKANTVVFNIYTTIWRPCYNFRWRFLLMVEVLFGQTNSMADRNTTYELKSSYVQSLLPADRAKRPLTVDLDT